MTREFSDCKVVFSLGSNCGDRVGNVESAIEWLKSILKDGMVHSPLYATPDTHGGPKQYINSVVEGRCPHDFAEMEAMCKRRELESGRTEAARAMGDVPIDIDIVIWNDKIIRPKDFKAPFFQLGYLEIAES